jgi:hypothetical protein
VDSTGFDARFQKEANLLATPSVRPALVKVFFSFLPVMSNHVVPQIYV